MPVPPDRRGAARSSAKDPLVYAVGLVSLLVYALHGFGGFLSRDLGVYTYAGQQFADGVPAYLGILTRVGPLAQQLPGVGILAARLVGGDDVLGARVLFLLFAVASVCVVYLLARNVFRSPPAGLVAAATFLCFSGFIEYASNGPREKTPMVLLLVLSLWAMERRRWLLVGVFISLATLTLQVAFFVTMPAALVAVLGTAGGRRLRSLVQVAVGGLIPVVVLSLVALVTGSLAAFVNAFLTINARYSVSKPITSDFGRSWVSLVGGYGLSLWPLLLGLVAIMVLGVVALVSPAGRADESRWMVVALGTATLAGLAMGWRDFDGWGDMFAVLPMAAIGIGGLVKVVADALPLRLGLGFAAAVTALGLVLALGYSVGHRDHRLAVQRASVTAVMRQAPAGSSIVSIQAPEALVLAGRTNPTKYQMFTKGFSTYLDDTYPGGVAGFGRRIAASHPTLIVIARKYRPHWMKATLRDDYRQVGAAPGWTWYARNSLGSTTLDAIHAANRRAVLARR